MSNGVLFGNFEIFLRSFTGSPAAKLREKFRFLSATDGLSIIRGRRDALAALYEEAITFVENEAVRSEFRNDLLLLQRGLYRELEDILGGAGQDKRHHFLIVVPVADRPVMLRKCLESLKEQCHLFGYGGMTVRPGGEDAFGKISVFVIDDSRDVLNRQKIREATADAESSGISARYIGPDEQASAIGNIPARHRRRVSRIVGAEGSYASHKGASLTRNIACLYMHGFLRQRDENVLIYFIDSDEEFRITARAGGTARDIPFINYFYWLDRIFGGGDVEVVTGKVVGDPPVTPSVMINTFLDDLISFLVSASKASAGAPCFFHDAERSGFSAEYHDMAGLFGYKNARTPHSYPCALSGTHTVGDCFADFSGKAPAFFYGLHPTRMQTYRHLGSFTETEAARTVYTGNYVMSVKGLRHFIPFAELRLRMAGPTLGRILKSAIGRKFVSANLPLLHGRTLSEEAGANEFRSGVSINAGSLDLSEEFSRQFWGDVMLFSVETLTESGYPGRKMPPSEIHAVVCSTRGRLLALYREQKRETQTKIARLRELISSPHNWWNSRTDKKEAVDSLIAFCMTAEKNFGVDSTGLRRICAQAEEQCYTDKITEAIDSFYEDRDAWEELLKEDHIKTSLDGAEQT